MTEPRFRLLMTTQPERAKVLLADAQRSIQAKYDIYRQLAEMTYDSASDDTVS